MSTQGRRNCTQCERSLLTQDWGTFPRLEPRRLSSSLCVASAGWLRVCRTTSTAGGAVSTRRRPTGRRRTETDTSCLTATDGSVEADGDGRTVGETDEGRRRRTGWRRQTETDGRRETETDVPEIWTEMFQSTRPGKRTGANGRDDPGKIERDGRLGGETNRDRLRRTDTTEETSR